MPRLATISGVRASLSAPFKAYTAEELGADVARCGLNGSPTQVVRTFTPDREHKAEFLQGTAAEAAAAALNICKEVLK